jgi:hypothetical protein
LIDARRTDPYRLGVALDIGFVRMTGRTLDAYKQIPKALWTHLGEQLGVNPPEVASRTMAQRLRNNSTATRYIHEGRQSICRALPPPFQLFHHSET